MDELNLKFFSIEDGLLHDTFLSSLQARWAIELLVIFFSKV